MITVEEYLQDNSLLEAYYTPYQQKLIICDQLIDLLKVSDEELWIIDYASFQPVKDSVILGAITNLDMVSKTDDDLTPFDILKKERKWDQLIASVKDEYDAFNEVIDMKLKTIKEHNSTSRILSGVSIYVSKLIGDINKIQEEGIRMPNLQGADD